MSTWIPVKSVTFLQDRAPRQLSAPGMGESSAYTFTPTKDVSIEYGPESGLIRFQRDYTSLNQDGVAVKYKRTRCVPAINAKEFDLSDVVYEEKPVKK